MKFYAHVVAWRKEKRSFFRKAWGEKNSESVRIYNKSWRKKNPKKANQHSKTWYSKNREKRRDSKESYRKRRILEDPSFRLTASLRERVREVLNGKSKSDRTLNLLGCSVEHLIRHLEAHFATGMSWDNYGKFGWHMDHIKPCASFNLTDPEQQRKCFHYSNIQPLWWWDNLSKGDSA
jgi:Prasinovirus endonuclease VII